MKVHYILLACCGLAFGLTTSAQNAKKDHKIQTQIASGDVARLDKQMSELMANRVSSTKMAADELAIAKLEEYNGILTRENLMFPADELYHSNWDTIHVNPFVRDKIEFPESYTIHCNTFSMPIDKEVKITSKYGPRRRRMHRGTDLKVQIGDTIRTVFEGKVRIKSYERRGYGNYVVIRHPNGLETVYGHFSKIFVHENQIVRSGQVIGLGGNTGRSSGPHLHFETRFLGKDINPEEIIDFENGVPHRDEYVFHNIKINGKKSNIYSTSPDAIAVHRVKKGENLGVIARRYGTTVSELCKLNGITSSSILQIGQAISVRAKQVTVEATPNAIKQTNAEAQASKTAPPTNRTSATNQASVTGTDSGKKIEAPVGATQQNDGEPAYHRIEKGDTLFSIAQKYGTTIQKLCELNQMENNIILKIGQKIRYS
jgi:murein DD-endopeptidase MepM/ murein hydrolase activator NlpD